MPFQGTWCWEFVVTVGTAEWFVTGMDSFMTLQGTRCWTTIVTLRAGEWLITTSVNSFMTLQCSWCWAFVVTIGAAEWLVTSVSSFMGLQIALLCECFVTVAAKESFFMPLHGTTASVRIGLIWKLVYYRSVFLSFWTTNNHFKIVVKKWKAHKGWLRFLSVATQIAN